MWRRTFGKLKHSIRRAQKVCGGTELTSNDKQQTICRKVVKVPSNICCFGAKSFYCESFSSKRKERQDYEAKNDSSYHLGDNLLEVFGWSGLIFLSWYISFPLCRRRAINNPRDRDSLNSVDFFRRTDYANVGHCISSFILKCPRNYVLPTVSAIKLKNDSGTSEEATHNGLNALEAAHNNVLSAISNLLGTDCMQKGQYSDAFSHFTVAAMNDHAAGAFNLGICYEMGLGTKQNFRMAAEQYKKAADLGHATAMYNLGVFYVHGWGGLESSGDVAKILFTAAAELGQADAMNALQLPKNENSKESSTDLKHPKDNDLTEAWFKVLNLDIMKMSDLGSSKERLISVDSGVDDLSPGNELDIAFTIG